jgi:hypothetical protein
VEQQRLEEFLCDRAGVSALADDINVGEKRIMPVIRKFYSVK